MDDQQDQHDYLIQQSRNARARMEEKLSDLDREHNSKLYNPDRTVENYPMSERYSNMYQYQRRVETDEKEN